MMTYEQALTAKSQQKEVVVLFRAEGPHPAGVIQTLSSNHATVRITKPVRGHNYNDVVITYLYDLLPTE